MIKEFEAKLLEKKNLAPEVWFFRFGLVNPKVIEFISGQYLLLKINNQRRSYSIASPDYLKDSFELVVKLLPEGVGSNYLRNLKLGDLSFFLGPVGFFTLRSRDKSKFFFAGGTGIAPIRSQIFSLLKNGNNNFLKLNLFWGLRTKKDVYFFEEFKELSKKHPNFNFRICLDQEENFEGLDNNYFYRGRVQQAFLDFIQGAADYSNLNDFEYYLCGPPPMVEALKEFLPQQGIKKENLFFEKF